MLIDSTGLGYTTRHGEILVHYPMRIASGDAQPDGVADAASTYASGWPIDPIPEWYEADPPNAITAERVQLWKQLLAEAAEE